MSKGCPFNDFEPCAKTKCKFYLKKVPEKCMIFAMADLIGKNNAMLVDIYSSLEE